METTETITSHQLPNIEPDIILTPQAQDYLRQAGKWASFLGIVGFVFTGLALIAAVGMSTMMNMVPAGTPLPAAFGAIFGFVLFLMSLLYFFVSLYLFQFGSRAKAGLTTIDPEQIALSFSKLKSFFKLTGIVTIIILLLYGVGLFLPFIISAGLRA